MLLMPMILPSVFKSGPPLFPGLMAASVWMTLMLDSPADVEIETVLFKLPSRATM
jgi:hypothetical protein